MTLNIGGSNTWSYIPKFSHSWGQKYNQQMVKLALMLHGSVKGIVSTLPGSPAVNDAYILSTNRKLYVWVDAISDPNEEPAIDDPAQWYEINPTIGDRFYVEDEGKMYVLNSVPAWVEFWNPAASHRAIQRELTFFVPADVRPSAVIASYVASTELAFPAGAAGSGAYCQTAPSASTTFSLRKNNVEFGTIAFASGSNDGVVTIASDTVILPAINDGLFTVANQVTIVSPSTVNGMQDLSVSLRGEIRSID